MSTELIARHTRNGVTAWQAVARMLGRSVDSVRSQYDPSYLKIRPWPHPCEEVVVIDFDDMRSPHVRPPPLRVRILALLAKQSASAQTIAAMTCSSLETTKMTLSRMKRDGMIQHTDRMPYTWSVAGSEAQGATALDVTDAIGLGNPELARRAVSVHLGREFVRGGRRFVQSGSE
jgi:hypothetical protein